MAGTIVLTSQRTEGVIRKAVITCTADVAAATFPATTLLSLGIFIDGTLLALQTNPGATSPTANYDITLVDGDGVDRFNSVGLNRHTTTSERVAITGAPSASLDEALTLTIINNAVNSAVVVLTLYWCASASGGAGSSAVDITTYVDGLEGLLTTPGTATVTSVSDTAASATLLSSSATRRGFRMLNDSTQSCYVKYGAIATTSDFTVLLLPGAYLEEDKYYGRVDGIWAADASGSMRITDLQP